MYEKIKLTNCARHCDVRVLSIELVDLLWFGSLSVCLFARPHFFEFPYSICVEAYLRGRHPLRISCSLKMGTMKARIAVCPYECIF